MINRKGILWTCMIFLIASLALPAAGKAQAGINLSIQAGFDGYCKPLTWIPVFATIENQGQDVEAQIEINMISSFNRDNSYVYPLSLPSVSRKTIPLHIRPDGFISIVTVRVTVQNKVIATARANLDCLGERDLLYAVVSENPGALSILSGLNPPSGRTAVARLGLDTLPDRAAVLESLDLIVFTDIDTSRITADQRAALETWTASGGQMMVVGGPTWQKTAAGLEDFMPFQPNGTTTLPDLRAFSEHLLDPDPLPGSAVVTTGELPSAAQAVISQADIPLVTARSLGFGRITYLAADPSLAPLERWNSLPKLLSTLIAVNATSPSWTRGVRNWDAASSALSYLPDKVMPAAWLVCGFLLLYVAAIGPGNFLLLRVLKRRELAWISIPVIVFLCSASAFIIGTTMRGGEAVISRVSLVQVWPDTDIARVDGLVGVFSPNRALFNLELPYPYLAHSMATGTSIGGRGSWDFVSTASGGTRVNNMRLDVAGMNAVAVRGHIPAEHIQHDLVLSISSTNRLVLEGTLTNTTQTAFHNAVVLTPGNASRIIGDFLPGQSISIQVTIPTSGRASQGSGITLPGSFTDTTVNDIMGSTGYYYSDPLLNQRFNFITALTSSSYGASDGRGGGVYLSAFTDGAPVEASLPGNKPAFSDSTLYIFALNPEFRVPESQLTLPPTMFSWTVVETDMAWQGLSPYDSYLEAGTHIFRFALAQPISFQSATGLTLHLKSYQSLEPMGLSVSLWDYWNEAWVLLPNLNWGDTEISDPDRFVSSKGEIMIRLERGQSSGSTPLERLDFTLEVER